MDKPITTLTLVFPHGATVKQAEQIAQFVENIVDAGISQGGMVCESGFHTDNLKFSDTSMSYTYGWERKLGDDVL
jgi:hypothetical protein